MADRALSTPRRRGLVLTLAALLALPVAAGPVPVSLQGFAVE